MDSITVILIKIFSSLLFGMFVLTILGSVTEIAYNIKQNRSTKPSYWVIPGIFGALFWFFSHL